ncbi:signal peptidase I SipW [Virgibacillus sp. CM-4]|uniref:signal peptidase I SipW n=1 Tax=Virgibacillus sp. CM-4 TaxID=1354277 RepID=UPI0004CE5B88|nr:signal peptidase I [Virgibacillus sp. CM-4]
MNSRQMLKRIGNLLTTLLFILLLCMLFLVLVSKATGNETNLFGYQLKTVLSGSMEPNIETGSIIAIHTEGDKTQFHSGDVITFRTEDDMLVTHRIVEVIDNGNQYITKGDANDGKDLNPVLSQNVVGTYSGFTIPYIGYIMNFAETKEGAALLLILPGILLLGYALFTIRRTIKEVKQLIDDKNMRTE